MSANFYLSSHANQHLHPRAALVTARLEDYRLANEQELGWIEIWSASGEYPLSVCSLFPSLPCAAEGFSLAPLLCRRPEDS